jgi:acetylornithine deacetylase/succinyl-diaminopimelate desuccinylase-like protein
MRSSCFAALLAILLAADAHAQVREWRVAHEREILREFVDLLALPNLAEDAPNISRNAAALEAMLERRGVATRVLTLEGAPPIVVGDVVAPGATRTIAFYAHYDGQPVDESQWRSAPWSPVMRDASGKDVDWAGAQSIDPEWRLYARSAGDDKAPIIAMMAALDALRAAKVRPRFNLRFVFEGEEEAGSPHLARFIEKYPDALHPDAWIICDGPMHQSRRAQLVFGVRGVVTLDLTVYGPVKALHDGHYGNWVPNPIVALAHLLTSMRDENGRILMAGFYDEVVPPTKSELAAVAAMPPIEETLRREFQIAATEGDGALIVSPLLNERIMLPALNVSGIQSGGVGEKASNTLQTSARAAIDFRLVPAQTPASVRAHVERHLASLGYTIVRDDPDAATRAKHARIVKVQWGSGYPAARTSLDLPLSREIAKLMTAAGHEPLFVPTMGGSLPIYLFQQRDNTPAVILPIANHDNNQHAANENLRLQNLWDAIDVFGALFAGLGR